VCFCKEKSAFEKMSSKSSAFSKRNEGGGAKGEKKKTRGNVASGKGAPMPATEKTVPTTKATVVSSQAKIVQGAEPKKESKTQVVKHTSIELVRKDITKMKIQCIVNASNESGLGCFRENHPCIDNAIHKAAGKSLLAECKKLGGVPEGTAKITGAHNLPCKYIIHTTGPKVDKANPTEDHKQLAQCYVATLDLAMKNKITEIAFCCISTGIYGFDKTRAAKTALSTVRRWLRNHSRHFEKIIFVLYTDEDQEIYSKLFYEYFEQ